MKVTELLEKISNKGFDLKKELEVKKYIPVVDKKKFAIDIIAECTDDVDNLITVDRFKMNICFAMRVLSEYTNLEVATDFDEMIVQYDTLCENEMLDKIIELFKNDYNAMYAVLEGELDELLMQNSIDFQVVRIANKISDILNSLNGALGNIDVKTLFPEDVDFEQLKKITNMLK